MSEESTWTKNDNPCLYNAHDDEPLFVLRAQDSLAPDTVEDWAMRAENAGVDANKVDEARRIAEVMREYQATNPSKLPD